MQEKIRAHHAKMWHTLLITLALGVCAIPHTACTTIYYNVWEKLGKEKRDLLKDNITAASKEQKETSQQFKDALTHIRTLYGMPHSDLQKIYDQISNDYEGSKRKADALRQRIAKVDTIANDLFSEWEQEIKEISDADLRANSQKKLAETKVRYQDMHAAMKRAERSMDPVLTALHDQALYLKHNLNAQALGVLDKESRRITKDIEALNRLMNESIRKADDFTKNLSNT